VKSRSGSAATVATGGDNRRRQPAAATGGNDQRRRTAAGGGERRPWPCYGEWMCLAWCGWSRGVGTAPRGGGDLVPGGWPSEPLAYRIGSLNANIWKELFFWPAADGDRARCREDRWLGFPSGKWTLSTGGAVNGGWASVRSASTACGHLQKVRASARFRLFRRPRCRRGLARAWDGGQRDNRDACEDVCTGGHRRSTPRGK
jgi:hypothetical protein